ncbi:MAG: bifunctional serine/threonine-protein kinase/formylglycine-generating enzyme family protein [Candidatus Promineifilaceae bacterium]|nr:bifunctional serine/threonine-protein kinase/formylglycine-generating enzyme family protein [Candidatus Promineifilaceae bacterium]
MAPEEKRRARARRVDANRDLMPYLPGETVHKRYRIAALLGQGPYGALYRGWDLRDEIEVAIKEYLDPHLETQKAFRREARRLSALKHPQLPTVRDHFALEGAGQYLIVDFIDGDSLQSLLDQYGPLPGESVAGWLQEACSPLSYLHEKGHLHLDVKPANIRVTPDGRVFLVDTGLSGLGTAPGTRGYAAPEQAGQSDVGPASDVYSMGATLYTLLTGQTPPGALQRESGLELLSAAREVNPDVEPYLSLVAARAMSLRPDARYETAADLARALQRPDGRASVQTPVEAPRRGEPIAHSAPARRLPEQKRREIEQKTMLGLLGLLALIVAAGIGLLTLGPNPLLAGEEAASAATATTQAQVIAALTAVAPTPTATAPPTPQPTATPAPFITNTGSRMLFIPGGLFRLGDDEGAPDEQPARVVRLAPFFIDETEVTNRAYLQCVVAEVCKPPANSSSAFYGDYYGNPAYADYPVVYVNWEQARTFCEWRDARLPSEAEWERAAGFEAETGVKVEYPWGDEFDGRRLNYCDVNCHLTEKRDVTYDDGYRDTAPVGNYTEGRSPAGLYDTLGNVMEWTSDWYDRNYYSYAPDQNPMGPAEGFSRSVRGGSWISSRDALSVSARNFYPPTEVRTNIGFRCAMPAP